MFVFVSVNILVPGCRGEGAHTALRAWDLVGEGSTPAQGSSSTSPEVPAKTACLPDIHPPKQGGTSDLAASDSVMKMFFVKHIFAGN